MIKSSNSTQELRLQRPGQSPTTMDSLKTSFLPNLSMDDGLSGGSNYYCQMCGHQYARQQLLIEHMQLCHHGPSLMMPTQLLPQPPPPTNLTQQQHQQHQQQQVQQQQGLPPPPNDAAHLKIEHPCLSCDDKFLSAHELDEHYRIAHQAFLARCLACGLYGISSTSLQEGAAGVEYKCMHCGTMCSAAALAGQQAYLEQQSTYMDAAEQGGVGAEEDDDSDEELAHQPPEVIVQQQPHQQQLKVPPLTVKLPKNSDNEHPHVVIKQELNETVGGVPSVVGNNGEEQHSPCTPQDGLPVYAMQQQQAGVAASSAVVTTGAAAAATNNKARHKCPDCPKTFKTPGTLAMHKKVHSGEADQTPKERPYTCSYCGKSFTQSNTLKQHTRIHTGEKPFQCSFCDKSFSVKDYLTKHIRTHTGEKPYSCTYCDKKFTQRSALTVHTTKLHPL